MTGMDYAKVIDEIFSQFSGPKFSVKLWTGKQYSYGKGSTNTFTLVFADPGTVKSLLSGGALGFGEAYMDGRLRIEGDLDAYFRLRHQFKHIRHSRRLIAATLLSRLGTPHTREDQIAQHYNIGNDFFETILDKQTMSYSAGIFEPNTKNLSEAQLSKLKLICTWLNLPKQATVLDLGSGWGGFARYAAQHHEWRITGYTLSMEQLKFCNEMVKQNNVEHLVRFKYFDMLEQLPEIKYDAVVLIESIEHVGKVRLASFFKRLHNVVKPGGSLYIQSTGQYKLRSVDAFILKYVFPGGYLPTLAELIGGAGEAGFVLDEFQDNTSDYLRTMTEWMNNLESQRPEIEKKFGPSFYRLWELWMHGARIAFEQNYMNLFRLQFRRPK